LEHNLPDAHVHKKPSSTAVTRFRLLSEILSTSLGIQARKPENIGAKSNNHLYDEEYQVVDEKKNAEMSQGTSQVMIP